jgi:N-acetylglucosaminyl-diphospho-decaprenol L-rhamnosyltransferase
VTSDPLLSIIIVNWNSTQFLQSCLASLSQGCSGVTHEVIVVDNGSFDGCAEMLATSFPSVRFIQSPENVGFAAANNLGARVATSDVLWLLNPDTEVRPGAGKALYDALCEDAAHALVGPC